MDFEQLKKRHRFERDSYPQALTLRIHRSLSWYKKAQECSKEDMDEKFIFLWIAFNAAYAQEFEQKSDFGEKGLYSQFFKKIVELDQNKILSDIVWHKYPSAIRLTLDNEFILEAYWKYQRGEMTETQWKQSKRDSNQQAHSALANCNIEQVLRIVFARLYTLRNQIMHGGSTYKSSANREQISNGNALLMDIVPVIISLMMDGKNSLWGDAIYPYIPN